MDEGGLRFSESQYYATYSSDEDDDSEDDASVGDDDEGSKDTSMRESKDTSMGESKDTSMGESADTTMGDKEPNNTLIPEFDGKHGFMRFNGKHYRDLSMKDLEGVDFKTIEEAEKFYTYYSIVLGFSIRKHRRDVDMDDPSLVVRREWVCSKQGEVRAKEKKKRKPNENITMQEDKSENEKRKKLKNHCPRGRRYTRIKCPAAFTIWYSKERGVYHTTRFKTEHNHDCVKPPEVHFLRSHREVKEHDIAQVESLRAASIRPSRAYELMVHQAGGYEFVGFTIKDLYNKLDAKRRLGLLKGDAHSAIGIMNLKASRDPEFYCKFQVDVEGRLANIFWRDGFSLAEYNSFGDVLIFDSTYKTNLYGKLLVVFVGTNHHRATVLFGCALLVDETVETYTWVLNSFLASMKGKKPISVLTDGDGAMRNAIKDLMPEASHRLCAWHIGRNIGQNVKGEDAQKSLSKFIYASLSEDDFEADWHSVVAMHRLENNVWVTTLYNNRQRWAHAFFRGQFFGGMCTTQRCEGIHSKFKKEMGRFTRLYEVVPRMDKTISRMRNRVVEDNFRGINSKPLLDSHMRVLEEHISKIFTHDIFVIIRGQIEFEKRFVMAKRLPYANVGSIVFYVTQYGRSERQWCVDYHLDEINPKFFCSCKLFESDGIPCAHIFCVMKTENVCKFPDFLVRSRWTRDATKQFELPKSLGYYPDKAIQIARYGALIAEVSQACYNLSFFDKGFNEALEQFASLRVTSQKYRIGGEKDNGNLAKHGDVLRDPEVAKTKGMHSKSGTKAEDVKGDGKNCRNCGKPGHNKRTCGTTPKPGKIGAASTSTPNACDDGVGNYRAKENGGKRIQNKTKHSTQPTNADPTINHVVGMLEVQTGNEVCAEISLSTASSDVDIAELVKQQVSLQMAGFKSYVGELMQETTFKFEETIAHFKTDAVTSLVAEVGKLLKSSKDVSIVKENVIYEVDSSKLPNIESEGGNDARFIVPLQGCPSGANHANVLETPRSEDKQFEHVSCPNRTTTALSDWSRSPTVPMDIRHNQMDQDGNKTICGPSVVRNLFSYEVFPRTVGTPTVPKKKKKLLEAGMFSVRSNLSEQDELIMNHIFCARPITDAAKRSSIWWPTICLNQIQVVGIFQHILGNEQRISNNAKSVEYCTPKTPKYYIFIPLHDWPSSTHWFLLVVDILHRKAELFDSYPNKKDPTRRNGFAQSALKHLDHVFGLEWLVYVEPYYQFASFDIVYPVSNPKQRNGYDCGAYVMGHMLNYGENWFDKFNSVQNRIQLSLKIAKHPMNELLQTLNELHRRRSTHKKVNSEGLSDKTTSDVSSWENLMAFQAGKTNHIDGRG